MKFQIISFWWEFENYDGTKWIGLGGRGGINDVILDLLCIMVVSIFRYKFENNNCCAD